MAWLPVWDPSVRHSQFMQYAPSSALGGFQVWYFYPLEPGTGHDTSSQALKIPFLDIKKILCVKFAQFC